MFCLGLFELLLSINPACSPRHSPRSCPQSFSEADSNPLVWITVVLTIPVIFSKSDKSTISVQVMIFESTIPPLGDSMISVALMAEDQSPDT